MVRVGANFNSRQQFRWLVRELQCQGHQPHIQLDLFILPQLSFQSGSVVPQWVLLESASVNGIS